MLSRVTRSKISALLVFALLLSTLMPVMAFGASVQLKDVADSYAQKEIQALVDAGVISGYEDGSFQPRKAMTRAELAKIIVLSLGLKENPDKAAPFKDVDATSWYRGYVGALVEAGITQGTSSATFSPNANVTREELVVFFLRGFGLDEAAAKLKADAGLSDLSQVSDWAKGHVSLAFKIGFVNGIGNGDGSLKFAPKENAERQALARLAYEFKTNKSKFIDKAKEIGKTAGVAVEVLEVTAVTAVSNTSVEVTFNQELTAVSKDDFKFDNNLTVTNAELKAGNKKVVVLTTSSQALNTTYKLSYKGKDTGKSIVGNPGGTGGGGGGGAVTTPAQTDAQKINSGNSVSGPLTVASSDTFGPQSGTTTVNGNLTVGTGTDINATLRNVVVTGTLTLNPGSGGEVTLDNVDAQGEIVVQSGSQNSVKLQNTIIKQLRVNAASQQDPVRIETSGTTAIVSTEVTSMVTLENKGTGTVFGNIVLNPTSSNKTVTLKGSYTSPIKVNGTVTLDVYQGANVGDVQLNSPSANATLTGNGTLHKVTNNAAGATLNVGDGGLAIGKIDVKEKLKLNGNQDKIKNIPIELPQNGNVGDFIEAVVDTIKDAINLAVAKAALSIGFTESDNATSVTHNLTLPATGLNSSTVTWNSNDDAIHVSGTTGFVTRKPNDTTVTLTATITVGGLSTTKAFEVIVKAQGSTNPATEGKVAGAVLVKGTTTPVEGAVVSITGTTYHAVTLADGSYSFAIPVGNYDLEVSKSGYHTVSGIAVAVVGGTTATVNINLEPISSPVTTGTVTGTVYIAGTTTPVVGASVSVTGTTYSTETNANGIYSISLPGGSYTLKAGKNGFQTVSVDAVTVTNGQITTQNISLTEEVAPVATTVSGIVYGRNAAPLSGVTVKLTGSTDVTTDSQGKYQFSNVTEGDKTLSIVGVVVPDRYADFSKILTVSVGANAYNVQLTAVTSAVYFNYGTSASVTSSTYGNAAGEGITNSIPAGADYIIVKFSDAIASVADASIKIKTVTNDVYNGTSISVQDAVYVAFKSEQALQQGATYQVSIDGLKLANDVPVHTVTFSVYQE